MFGTKSWPHWEPTDIFPELCGSDFSPRPHQGQGTPSLLLPVPLETKDPTQHNGSLLSMYHPRLQALLALVLLVGIQTP